MDNEIYRELIERSHLLHELQKQPGWPVLVDYMQTIVMKPYKDNLLNGKYDNLAQYKQASGYCAGVERVLKLADELGGQVERERERKQEAAAAAEAEAAEAR